MDRIKTFDKNTRGSRLDEKGKNRVDYGTWHGVIQTMSGIYQCCTIYTSGMQEIIHSWGCISVPGMAWHHVHRRQAITGTNHKKHPQPYNCLHPIAYYAYLGTIQIWILAEKHVYTYFARFRNSFLFFVFNNNTHFIMDGLFQKYCLMNFFL